MMAPASAAEMTALAVKLWGEPNRALSNTRELRFGSNGSKSLKLTECVYFDHEADKGGGYRDLYRLVNGQFPPNGTDPDADFATLAHRVFRLKPVAWWDYRNAAGVGVARVVRFDPKDFRQCRPDGEGGWKWSLQGQLVPLYRLPELIEAPIGATVYITEGERKADALRAWGLVATTCCMGAKKFRPHHAEALAGRNVVILPDNDEAGRKHAEQVTRELRGAGARPGPITLPGLAEKGDILNWIAAGHTAARIPGDPNVPRVFGGVYGNRQDDAGARARRRHVVRHRLPALALRTAGTGTLHRWGDAAPKSPGARSRRSSPHGRGGGPCPGALRVLAGRRDPGARRMGAAQ